MERFLQTKGRLGRLKRDIKVLLTLNDTAFLLPFSGSDTFVTQYRNMTKLQRELMSKQVKGKAVVLTIRDRLNGAEGII